MCTHSHTSQTPDQGRYMSDAVSLVCCCSPQWPGGAGQDVGSWAGVHGRRQMGMRVCRLFCPLFLVITPLSPHNGLGDRVGDLGLGWATHLSGLLPASPSLAWEPLAVEWPLRPSMATSRPSTVRWLSSETPYFCLHWQIPHTSAGPSTPRSRSRCA